METADRVLHRWSIPPALLFGVLGTLASTASCAAGLDGRTVPDCGEARFLSVYEHAGLVGREADGTILVHLVADRHSADCGAPDCYGTKITIIMKPAVDGSHCIIRDAHVHVLDYFEAGCEPSITVQQIRRAAYFPVGGQADLNDASLEKLTLRSEDGTRAVVLLPKTFFYFDHVTPDGILRTRLPGDGDDEAGCCWGATSSRTHFVEGNGKSDR